MLQIIQLCNIHMSALTVYKKILTLIHCDLTITICKPLKFLFAKLNFDWVADIEVRLA